MRWPGPAVRLFSELDAWRASIGPTVEVEERPADEPFPLVVLTGLEHGDVCVIGDPGGRYLVRARGSDVVVSVEPRGGVLPALLQRFDRASMEEVRAFTGEREREAWLEVDGFPVLWGLGHPLSTRMRMRRADWREERRVLAQQPPD